MTLRDPSPSEGSPTKSIAAKLLFHIQRKTITPICACRGLRNKSDRPGKMIFAFVCEVMGWGLVLSDEQLTKVTAWRTEKYGAEKSNLVTTPGLEHMRYGQNRDGYWNHDTGTMTDMFEEQVMDVLDVYECLYPCFQVCLEVDHSQGHGKEKEGGLGVEKIGVKVGGGAADDALGVGSYIMLARKFRRKFRLVCICYKCTFSKIPIGRAVVRTCPTDQPYPLRT